MAQLYVRVVPGDKKEKLKNILQVLNLIWVIYYFFCLFFKHLNAFKMSLRPQWRKIFLQVFNMGWRLRLVVDVDVKRTKIRDTGWGGGGATRSTGHTSVCTSVVAEQGINSGLLTTHTRLLDIRLVLAENPH